MYIRPLIRENIPVGPSIFHGEKFRIVWRLKNMCYITDVETISYGIICGGEEEMLDAKNCAQIEWPFLC